MTCQCVLEPKPGLQRNAGSSASVNCQNSERTQSAKPPYICRELTPLLLLIRLILMALLQLGYLVRQSPRWCSLVGY